VLEHEDVKDLVLDLEQRIDRMQNMGDTELGGFNRLDWVVLILSSIIVPIVLVVAFR
jgi:ribosomal silencing factor RsfS